MASSQTLLCDRSNMVEIVEILEPVLVGTWPFLYMDDLAMELPSWVWHPCKQQAERRSRPQPIPLQDYNLSLALWPGPHVSFAFDEFDQEIIALVNTLICLMYQPHLKCHEIMNECERLVRHFRRDHFVGQIRVVVQYILDTYMEEATSSRWQAWRRYQADLWFAVE